MRVILIRLALGASTAVAAPKGQGPTAPDTDMLANVLSTAFLAKNLTLVCSQQARWFAEDIRTGDFDSVDCADHVQQEMLDRLAQTNSASW